MEINQAITPLASREDPEYRMTISPSSSPRSLGVVQPEKQAVTIQRQAVKQLARQYRGFTPALAFQSDEPTINALIKEQGIDEVEATFTLHLVALSRYLNLKAGLQEDQIDYIVEKLTTDYKWLKMADFAIIIDRIKSNQYGEFYENFNGNKFFDILAKYDVERTMEIERIRTEENNVCKQEWRELRPAACSILPYYIDKEGCFHLTEKEQQRIENEQAEKKAAEEERQRRKELSRAIMDRAYRIQVEQGCTIQQAYDIATQEHSLGFEENNS
jgi:hypothetical protein